LGTTFFHPKKASDVLVTQHFEPGANPQALATVRTIVQQQPGFFTGSSPKAFYTEGMMQAMEGNRDAALISYRKSVELLERDRRKLRDDESRGTFLEDKIEYYYAPALLLLDMQQFGEAFELLERSRSRSMADLLASSPLKLRTPLERELFSESMKLKAEIAIQQKKLFGMSAGAERTKQGSDIPVVEAQIGTLEGQLQNVQTRIATETPKLEELTVSQPVSLESAQRSAALEHYDLLYYLVQGTAVVIWDINEAGVKVFNVFLPRSEVTAKVAALRNSLIEHEKNQDAKFDEQTSRELFLFLIQPVLKSVKTNHLVIVPHEDLNNLPYQVLQDPSEGTYLGERFQISYAMSATVLESLKKKPNLAGSKLLAVAGSDIVDASNEVEAIGRLFPNRSKVVKDVPVNKEEVKSWVASYDLVHLSVHGVFNAQDPLLSYLKLSPTSVDNGRLTAAEMFGLPLTNGSFVVLSACQTGQVEATHANEVLGMVRALLYAGANNLVLSSWEVESKATELWMVTFYREAQTHSASEAARLALLAVKSHPEYRDPYYWGPFLMTGK
jgi:CHAT domain-containing protein